MNNVHKKNNPPPHPLTYNCKTNIHKFRDLNYYTSPPPFHLNFRTTEQKVLLEIPACNLPRDRLAFLTLPRTGKEEERLFFFRSKLNEKMMREDGVKLTSGSFLDGRFIFPDSAFHLKKEE
jgi:hypothetical protein